MARINIDTEAFSDWRFAALGTALGTSKFDAIGRCAAVWHHCLLRQTHELPVMAIDACAEMQGFAAAMIKAQLAIKVGGDRHNSRGSVRVRGLGGRIEWLAVRRENSKKGGEANASRVASQEGAKREPSVSGSGSCSKEERTSPPVGVASPAPRPVRQKPDPTVEAADVAVRLLDAIRSHWPGYSDGDDTLTVRRWALDIDLAIREDKRTAPDLLAALNWAHRTTAGHFWRRNVLSGKKLRKNYLTLAAQMRDSTVKPKGGDSARAMADLRAAVVAAEKGNP